MPINFNVSPYYDDFDAEKNYHRILFKPGNAVQARELTQSQTILQNQITSFANHIFAENSPVSGAKISTNFKCYYVKLLTTYNNVDIDVNEFEGLLVKSQFGTVLAKVIAVADATGGDPPTLILSYLSGQKFADGDVIYAVGSALTAQAISLNSTGLSSTAHITQGVFYVLGNFVVNPEDTVILSKYSITPSVRLGLEINETIVDYVDDSSLLDPAVGATNYQAPGADRYKIGLSLQTRPIQFGDDQNFIELMRIENGSIIRKVDSSVYSVIDDYFAKRTYDTNGDYVVQDFTVVPKANTTNSNLYTMAVGKGLAYVHGYRLENQSPLFLSSSRARTTETLGNNPVYMDFGSYLYINSVRGTSGIDIASNTTIDLHCVPTANIDSTNTATYSSTVVANGYIRGLLFDDYGTSSDANSYIYKAYVYGMSNATKTANATGGGASTITLPGTYSTYSNAYYGVSISITDGPSSGDYRTITSYNGTTRVATVDRPWTTTPTTASVFSLNFGIKDAETLVTSNTTLHLLTTSILDNQGRVGNISTGDVELQNPAVAELLFRVGMPYVSSLSDTSYTTLQMFRGVTFTPSGGNLVATLPFGGDYNNVMRHLGAGGTTLSADTVRQNFIVIITNKGSSSYDVGDLLPWTINSRTVTLNADASIATLTGTTADLGGTFTAMVVCRAFVSNAENTGHILRNKNLIEANTTKFMTSNTAVGSSTYTYVDDASLTSTGQVYIQNAGLVTPGSKQSLYVSDVKKIVKIIDTLDPAALPNATTMFSNTAHDITNNFVFDNGQRDGFYDHASVTLKIGAPKVKGNMLVFLDYYQHTGGDGYFSVESYLNSSSPEDYREIGSYTSSSGATYKLRDVLDFRPTRVNASPIFQYRFSNAGDTQRYGTLLPVDLSTFTCDYSFYLGRRDKLVLSKDRSFQIIEGAPAVNPIFPVEPDSSLLLANIIHNPYTGYLPTEAPAGVTPDLSITKVKHKRYTMQDIATIEDRVNNLEYYTSLNLLEQQTESLQITDAYGLNRFKNGIVVDNFTTYLVADTSNPDHRAAINIRENVMSPMHGVKNFPLKSIDIINTNARFAEDPGYSVDRDGENFIFSLPYTTANVANQRVASRAFNLNPFTIPNRKGTVSVTPNIDPGKPQGQDPTVIVTPDPAVVPVYPPVTEPEQCEFWVATGWNGSSVSDAGNYESYWADCLTKNPDTTGDWKTVSTSTYVTEIKVPNDGAMVNLDLPDPPGLYDKFGKRKSNVRSKYSAYDLDLDFASVDGVVSYARGIETTVSSEGMLSNANVNVYYDGTTVDKYVQKTNEVVVDTVVGDGFKSGDLIGYESSGTFVPTAKVIGTVKNEDDTTTLHVVGEKLGVSSYSPTSSISVAKFNLDGTYDSAAVTATVTETIHWSGQMLYAPANDPAYTTSVQLSPLAASTDVYTGKTFYNTSTGESASIESYNTSTKVVTLSNSISTFYGYYYSIGNNELQTNSDGSLHVVINIPDKVLVGGDRTIRIDDSAAQGSPGEISASTTAAETSVHYSTSITQTVLSQDPAASISGSGYTFNSVMTEYQSNMGKFSNDSFNLGQDGALSDGGLNFDGRLS